MIAFDSMSSTKYLAMTSSSREKDNLININGNVNLKQVTYTVLYCLDIKNATVVFLFCASAYQSGACEVLLNLHESLVFDPSPL